MATRYISFLMALSCTILLGASAVSQSVEPAQPADSARTGMRDINLGLATASPTYLDGTSAVINVAEAPQRRDLNGDGDMDDVVIHVFDAITGEVRNLGLSTPGDFDGDGVFFTFPPLLEGRLLAFLAREERDDLNGDGDTSDTVLHVYDTERRSLSNLRLALDVPPLLFDGRSLAVAVNEATQGQGDLNRDGDADDDVLYVYDVVTRRTRNTALAVVNFFPEFFDPVDLTKNQIAFTVGEQEQGSSDLNGDGDATDQVVYVLDTAGRVRNLRLAAASPFLFSRPDAGAGVVVVVVQEEVDLNGDQDVTDGVLHVVDIGSGRIRNTGLVVNQFAQTFTFDREQELVFLNVAEALQGRDLNGDGDLNDFPLHVISTRTGQIRNLRISAFTLAVAKGRGVFVRQESDAGPDLNGDGDLEDSVVSLADFNRDVPRIVNTGLAISTAQELFDPMALQIRDNFATFLVSEAQQGNRDLNTDGDTADVVLHIADLSTLTTRNSGLDGSFAYRSVLAPVLPPSGGRVAVPVSESSQGGRDLNRDGDTNDVVLQSFDLRSGRARNTGLAIAIEEFFPFDVPLMIRGETFVSLLVPEGSVDLNADGDTADRVLHLLDVATGRITNAGRAGRADVDRQRSDLDFSFAGLTDSLGLEFEVFFWLRRPNTPGPGPGDAFTFLVSEATQGNVDLNGDGDTDDTVVHATRLTDRDRDGRFDFAEDSARRAGEELQ